MRRRRLAAARHTPEVVDTCFLIAGEAWIRPSLQLPQLILQLYDFQDCEKRKGQTWLAPQTSGTSGEGGQWTHSAPRLQAHPLDSR